MHTARCPHIRQDVTSRCILPLRGSRPSFLLQICTLPVHVVHCLRPGTGPAALRVIPSLLLYSNQCSRLIWPRASAIPPLSSSAFRARKYLFGSAVHDKLRESAAFLFETLDAQCSASLMSSSIVSICPESQRNLSGTLQIDTGKTQWP